MKLKDMVFLHDINTMREFLENNGVHGATDKEIEAFYDVFEGHGYELFARSLKDDKFIRFDSCGSDLEDIDETDEELVHINSIDYELSYAYELLDELYEEYLQNGEDECAIDCKNARDLVSDLCDRYEDKREPKIEFYTLVNDYINFNCYEKDVAIFHSKTKEEGLKEFEKIVKEYKNNWIDKNDYLDEGKLGEFDDLKEYENDNISYFGLFLDDQCCIEVSLEKVVL